MLITSDLHLTDRARDEYRWGIFPQLRSIIVPGEPLWILGDLTDAKDGHSARLVNRIMDELLTFDRVVIVQGNHDYVDEECAFFSFLKHAGLGDNLMWVDTPTLFPASDILALPHARDPSRAWSHKHLGEAWKPELVLCHQTFNGANAGNHVMNANVGPKFFEERFGWTCPVVSGDIHVPQTLGPLTYCGSPYPTAFADEFTPRVLRWEVKKRRLKSVKVSSIRRATLDIFTPSELLEHDLSRGDQAKVRIHLYRKQVPLWPDIKAELVELARAEGIVLHAVEMKVRGKRARTSANARAAPISGDVLEAFIEDRGVPRSIAEAGKDFVR